MRDIVCGKELGEAVTKAKVEIDGKTHYFCSASCAGNKIHASKPEKPFERDIEQDFSRNNCSAI